MKRIEEKRLGMGEKELGGCNREENEAEREEENGTLELLEFVFNDVCFPPRCDDRIKIKTSPLRYQASKCPFRQQTFWIHFWITYNRECTR